MDRPARLSQRFVDGIKEPGRYFDGSGAFGLSLLVRITRAGSLSRTYQRVQVDGRPRNLGLGSAASVSLSDARATAAKNGVRLREARRPTGINRLLAEVGSVAVGVNPQESTAPTVGALWEDYLQLKSAAWKPGSKTESGEQSRFIAYVTPNLVDRPIDRVERGDLVDVLSVVWHTRPKVATKLKRSLNGLLDFAVGRGHIEANPIQYAVLALGRQKSGRTKHHGAIRWQDAPAALAYVRASRTYAAKKLALELLMLTAVRSGEVRGARRQEFSPPTMTWTIPADRMKGGREHRIPLSPAAFDVLRQAYETSYGIPDGLVFPTNKGGAISDDGLRQLLVRRFPGTTAHGLRSTFRDWAAEQTDFPAEIAEHALAHLEGSATIRAYLRTDYFEKRRALMNDWADFLNRAS